MKVVTVSSLLFPLKLIMYHSKIPWVTARFIIPTHMSTNSENLVKISPVHALILGGICQIYSFFTQVCKWATWSMGLLDQSLPNFYTLCYWCGHWNSNVSILFGLPECRIKVCRPVWLKIRCDVIIPWAIGKRRPDPWYSTKYLQFEKKSSKSVW